MRLLLVIGLAFVSCGRGREEASPPVGGGSAGAMASSSETADSGTPVDAGLGDGGVVDDAGVQVDAGTADAGGADAGAISWERDVHRLLVSRCAGCHTLSRVDFEPRFLDAYQVMGQLSTRCPGERVGDCVSRALQIQAPEGSRCRTYLTPFHREGWECLTPAEVRLVVDWVSAGMLER